MSGSDPGLQPFVIAVDDAVLADLHRRLGSARLPLGVPGEPWAYGIDLGYLAELVAHWRERYDWRAHEAQLNTLPQYVTDIDGQRIHVVHAPAERPSGPPLLLLNGWPSSFVEFFDVIPRLTRAPEGEAAFDAVVPSMPGYGFSSPLRSAGWTPERIARAYLELMDRLGYESFGVHGGDWGASVARSLATLAPERVVGLHLTFVTAPRPEGAKTADLASAEQHAIAAMRAWQAEEAGYSAIQGTKPHTIGAALEDSPTGLAAWIVEKFRTWSDCGGDLESRFSKDQLLTNVMIYWVTATATSSARLYWEARHAAASTPPFIAVPTAVAQYPGEVTRLPRAWIERCLNVVRWTEMPRGGHFAPMEEPELFAADVRAFFAGLRR